MESLYNLTEDYQVLMEYADSTDPDDEQVFLDTLDSVTATINVKMDDYAVVMDHMKEREDLIDLEIKRLTARKNAISNNRTKMRERLYDSMLATDRTKVSTDLHTFSIVKNGGKLPLIINGDVPDKYMKVIMEPDKDLIRTALETGNTEVLKFAHFGERGTHLSIK
jgi:chaperonin cofactor prefoldin